MKALSKIIDGLNKFYRIFYYLAGFILMGLLAVSCFVVVSRQFRFSPIWSDELQRFMMVAMVFIAIPYMASSKSFLVVDLADIFFHKKKKLHDMMIIIGEIIFLALLIYLIFPCIQIVRNTRTFSTALALPMAYMYALMPMSFFFGAVAMAKNLLERFVISRNASDTGEAV